MKNYEDMTREELIKVLKNLEQSIKEPNGEDTLHKIKTHHTSLERQNEYQEESDYASFYNFAPLGYCILDENGLIRNANLTLAKLLGVGRNILHGMPFRQFISERDMEKFFIHLKKCKETTENVSTELCLKGRHGQASWIGVLSSPMGNSRESHTVITDITEQRKSKEALEESERKLSEARKMAQLGYWFWDINTGNVEWSEEVFNIFHLNPDEFKPHIDSILALSPWPEDHERDRELIRKAMEHHEKGTYEQRFLRPDKSIGYYHSTFQGNYDDAGNLISIMGTVMDITERKQAEEEQKKLQTQLLQAQKMESVGRLAGGVAHDFNNILGIIIGYTELIIMDMNPAGQLYSYLQQILDSAGRAAELVKQLLAFARKQIASPEILDVNTAVVNMFKMLQRLIGEDIELIWKPGHDIWKVNIDPVQVDQILANLTVNSRDAIPDTGTITIETENIVLDYAYTSGHAEILPGEYVLLTVSDNGIGMSKELMEHIFEPFFTTKEIGKGTGLGLATVYGIVRQNNGFINVYSEPGQGTSFKIYLPRFKSDIIPDKPEKMSGKPKTGTETVLITEDEEDYLISCKIILEKLGYTVLTANTPEYAIDIAQNHTENIDLLITDVVMPKMNGKELVKKIHSIRPDMKYLYMSGYTANVIAHHGVLEKGVNFLQKPFSIKTVAEKVREVLDSSDC